jgi:hypothetical protein
MAGEVNFGKQSGVNRYKCSQIEASEQEPFWSSWESPLAQLSSAEAPANVGKLKKTLAAVRERV